MEKQKKKIVIYGGSFSPPHIGHSVAIETVVRLFLCDELWIMPSGDRKDKKMSASDHHRVAMLKLMKNELFGRSKLPIKISNLELQNPGLTTTYATMGKLKQKFPTTEFHFLIGSELVKDIKPKWIHGKKIYTEVRFIALERNKNHIPRNIPKNFTILKHNVVYFRISSTFVRSLIARGHSGLPYVTPNVARYIKKYKLYKK